MSVHPIERKFDELQLTLTSADFQFVGVAVSEAILPNLIPTILQL